MAKNSSVVEVNGHRYDAVTGRLIGAVHQAASSSAQVIDGFTRRPVQALAPVKKAATGRPKRAAQAVHQKAQRSRTVMRSVVSRPKLKVQKPAETADKPRRNQPPVSSSRLFRAKTILRHPNIKHFAERKMEAVEVLPPAAARISGGQTQALARPLPSLAGSLSHTQVERMLDHALARADAHKQALKNRATGPLKHVRRLPRWLSFGLIALVILGVGSFLAWQKFPGISLKVASSRAHVNASEPAYIPSGYTIASPARFEDGAVKLELRSTSDKNKTLTITQQKSNLDSESLKDTVVPTNAPVQTSEANGAPMYIYGKQNDAVFKKGNTKVTIDNNADLPPNELSSIAKSLN